MMRINIYFSSYNMPSQMIITRIWQSWMKGSKETNHQIMMMRLLPKIDFDMQIVNRLSYSVFISFFI